MLARIGEARVSLPGGCAIGTRPVDLLLMAMQKLGAEIDIDAGYVVAQAPKGLVGGEIEFPKVTVGGTHTALDGRGAGARLDADPQRRAGAGGARPRRLPHQDGRAHKGRGYAGNRGGRRCASQRRSPSRAAGPDRGRHLCRGGRDDRRRSVARGHRPGPAARRRSTRSSRRAPASVRTIAASGSSATAPAFRQSRSRPRHSPASPPICRRSSWR